MTAGNYNDLAERFMHLWQQQAQAMMKDGDFIKQCFDALQNMSNYTNPATHEHAKQNPAAHASHDALAYELRQLNHRLKLAEERIEQLEAERAASAKRPASSTGGSSKKTVRSTPKKRG